ncbi:pentatricopeptide repeat-containing protein At3g04750, mitochondrial [Euphorbia lathyris]|uniref:pentatricopeptide repeat-containing protein At3g04750, mitochondrial n=1 Tax=Euphorbia lathyris TaxID=212925 RepID=UPI003313533B
MQLFSYMQFHSDAISSMYRYGRGIRFYRTTATSKSPKWDPTISLELNHPSLVLLEKINCRDHFKQILAHMMRSNLIGQNFPMSRLIFFSAVSYPENLDMALILFNHYTPSPNLYIYNTMISALSSVPSQAFVVYSSMLRSGIYPDKHTLLKLLLTAKHVSEVKQIQCHAVVLDLSAYTYLQNSLIKIYLENKLFWLGHRVFEQITSPDLVSFNIMISNYAKKGCGLEVIKLLHDMMASSLEPDEFTMSSLLVSYGQMGEVRFGKAVHAWMERRKSITLSNLILGNALLDMYIKCKELDYARSTFFVMTEKDVVSWNTMIAGCSQTGDMELAHRFFNQMPSRDLISWNSLITGYASNGDFTTVRNLFCDMVMENFTPDNVTMVGLVSAAAEIGALSKGKWAHGWIIRKHLKIDALLGSALIDMYCKCGSIDKAFFVFRDIIVKDVIVWTTMITGFAFHGCGSKALELFFEMQEHVAPNEVTFVSVLTACSHSGLVDEGYKIFSYMKEYGIEPRVEHYGCLVDLLGRSGRLTEAKDIIERMPMKPSRSIWGSILNCCRAQGDVAMAEIALSELVELEPEEEGGYMLLSNIYAANGRWSYCDKIREAMENRGVRKTAGCSSVVVDGVFHIFVAADKWHPRLEQVKLVLNILTWELKLGSDFPLESACL